MEKVIIVTALAGFVKGFLSNDIKILQNKGFEVHCAANNGTGDADSIRNFFSDAGVVFHQVDFDSKNPFSTKGLKAYRQLKKLFDENDFKLIHFHTPIAGFIGRIAARKKRKKGTKVIYTTHGFYFHNHSSKKDWLIFYPIEYVASIWSDAIITINNEDFERAKKMRSPRCYHINSVGLDVERYKNVEIDRDAYRESIGVKKDDIMVLAAGELSVRKNHQVVIKALGKLKNKHIIFVLCGRAIKGQGTYDLLQQLAKENNVRLSMLGFRSDMPQIYHCADIGVLPSIREGLGMAGIQTLYCGVPLVTSNVHGIVDYMENGKTGYMYAPDDVEGFADGIAKLCNEKLRKSMRNDCVQMALKFSSEVTVEQMSKIYDEVLEII